MASERDPRTDSDQDLKPDILEEGESGPLPPGEALRRDINTYADTDLDQNREDIEDEHHADSDEHL